MASLNIDKKKKLMTKQVRELEDKRKCVLKDIDRLSALNTEIEADHDDMADQLTSIKDTKSACSSNKIILGNQTEYIKNEIKQETYNQVLTSKISMQNGEIIDMKRDLMLEKR